MEATDASMKWTALVMQPGTTANLCVTYSVGTNDLPLSDFAAAIYRVTVTPTYDSNHNLSGHGYSYSPATDPSISWDSSSLHYSGANGSFTVTVVYTISASNIVSGFYDLTYPNNCPPLIPFAVVGSFTTVSSSDFPQGFFFDSSCRLEGSLGHPTVTGYSGMITTIVQG